MKQEFVVAAEDAGERLDRYVAARLPGLSRSRVQELIAEGLLCVDGRAPKPAHKLRAGERVEVDARPRPALRAEPEAIPLEILYEDDDVLVVNKPAGMIVHTGAGRTSGTLVNALLGRGQALSRAISSGGPDASGLRPGIVHRLDRETSGAILVAKNDAAHAALSEQFRARTVQKTYLALVHGKLPQERGRIELAIARDPKRRVRMTARRTALGARARAARTDWRVLARLDGFTLAEVQLHTGRTHQIRVHFAALHHPVVGDALYGAARQVRTGKVALSGLGRNFLHSARLGFTQPRTGKWIEVVAPLPRELCDYLRRLAAALGRDAREIDACLAGYL
jgi:23S rRNA pseudouridine1911/1915/1917 synthase